MSIANAVKIAVARGHVDGEWNRAHLLGKEVADAHMNNEHFAMCSGKDSRTDYYAMWIPTYRKANGLHRI